jgi:Rubrerythrin
MEQQDDFFAAVTSLGGLKELDIAALRLLFRIECSGEDFYNQLADKIGNPQAADLLRRNGREERAHAERVRRVIGIKLGHNYQPTAEDTARYAIPLPPTIDASLLPLIVQGELAGDADYHRWAERESDPEAQRLLRQNGKEETTHGQRVQQVIALLTGAG